MATKPTVHQAESPGLSHGIDLGIVQQWIERVGPTLFPPQCYVAAQRYDSAAIALPAVDDDALRHAVEGRRREFSAGRVAAGAALRKSGLQNTRVPVGENRQPRWPSGVVGSITHTAGLAVAVTARQEHFLSIGLDLERANAVKHELWASLLSEAEMNWISGHPQEQQSRLATLVFCAKESFYKLQYPLTGQWLDFQNVDVAIVAEGEEFHLTCIEPLITKRLGRSRFAGRYASAAEFVLTAMHLARPNQS